MQRADAGFFPASGYRNFQSGSMAAATGAGYGSYASPASTANGFYLRAAFDSVVPDNAYPRAFGFAVRCLQAFAGIVRIFHYLCPGKSFPDCGRRFPPGQTHIYGLRQGPPK